MRALQLDVDDRHHVATSLVTSMLNFPVWTKSDEQFLKHVERSTKALAKLEYPAKQLFRVMLRAWEDDAKERLSAGAQMDDPSIGLPTHPESFLKYMGEEFSEEFFNFAQEVNEERVSRGKAPLWPTTREKHGSQGNVIDFASYARRRAG